MVGIQRAKPVVASAEAKLPKHILTNKAILTVKPSKSKKTKSAMQLKKVEPRDVTTVTI